MKREDAGLILDGLRQALPGHDAAHAAALAEMQRRIGETFDRVEELQRQQLEESVQSAIGKG